ncbi:hypothetical protein [Fictibacillus phosphorivorans]|uniref:hypothetical protein n=1 Tax=Fictibacillus phosphorivorans TaxID=1221500 RepID=UPI00203F105A|nr:hypothetical protein [Fictibacillus phosphorivorans]MCM3719490.1 hypothetical protein [Fictibacillus phosphorivorans]MCM3777181.1 hypothetical protein [Fictibacillus phosphorivorans]
MREKEGKLTQGDSDDLTQLVEIINAKGDTGELKEIANKYEDKKEHSPLCNDDFFYTDLRAIAEDGAKED